MSSLDGCSWVRWCSVPSWTNPSWTTCFSAWPRGMTLASLIFSRGNMGLVTYIEYGSRSRYGQGSHQTLALWCDAQRGRNCLWYEQTASAPKGVDINGSRLRIEVGDLEISAASGSAQEPQRLGFVDNKTLLILLHGRTVRRTTRRSFGRCILIAWSDSRGRLLL